jgi:hypothetical protein
MIREDGLEIRRVHFEEEDGFCLLHFYYDVLLVFFYFVFLFLCAFFFFLFFFGGVARLFADARVDGILHHVLI